MGEKTLLLWFYCKIQQYSSRFLLLVGLYGCVPDPKHWFKIYRLSFVSVLINRPIIEYDSKPFGWGCYIYPLPLLIDMSILRNINFPRRPSHTCCGFPAKSLVLWLIQAIINTIMFQYDSEILQHGTGALSIYSEHSKLTHTGSAGLSTVSLFMSCLVCSCWYPCLCVRCHFDWFCPSEAANMASNGCTMPCATQAVGHNRQKRPEILSFHKRRRKRLFGKRIQDYNYRNSWGVS